MYKQITLINASSNLAELCDRAVDNREPVIITREGEESVALIAADELESLMETAYLLRSPKNAARLLSALQSAKAQDFEPGNIQG